MPFVIFCRFVAIFAFCFLSVILPVNFLHISDWLFFCTLKCFQLSLQTNNSATQPKIFLPFCRLIFVQLICLPNRFSAIFWFSILCILILVLLLPRFVMKLPRNLSALIFWQLNYFDILLFRCYFFSAFYWFFSAIKFCLLTFLTV